MGDQDFTEERAKVSETEEIIDGKNVEKRTLRTKIEDEYKFNGKTVKSSRNDAFFGENIVSGQQNQINYHNKNVKSESRKCQGKL